MNSIVEYTNRKGKERENTVQVCGKGKRRDCAECAFWRRKKIGYNLGIGKRIDRVVCFYDGKKGGMGIR